MLIRKTNEDTEEKKRYELQSIPSHQSILQLEEAAEKMQLSVDNLKPFEVNSIRLFIVHIFDTSFEESFRPLHGLFVKR